VHKLTTSRCSSWFRKGKGTRHQIANIYWNIEKAGEFQNIIYSCFIDYAKAWNGPLVSLIFLMRSLVFPTLLFSSISLHWSMRKSFLSLLASLWNSAFRWLYLSFSPLPFTSFLSYCKAPSDNHLGFLNFFFLGWLWSLPPAQCREPPSIVLQALCQI